MLQEEEMVGFWTWPEDKAGGPADGSGKRHRRMRQVKDDSRVSGLSTLVMVKVKKMEGEAGFEHIKLMITLKHSSENGSVER